MSDIDSIGDNFNSAVNDFRQLTIDSVVSGFKQLGNIISALPNSLSQCTNLSGDVEKLKNWAQIFSDPITLAEKFVTNVIGDWDNIYSAV